MDEGIFAQHRLYLYKIRERSNVFVSERTKRARIRLLSSAMHDLVISTPENLPPTFLRRMRRQNVLRSIARNAIDHCVEQGATIMFRNLPPMRPISTQHSRKYGREPYQDN